ncbi:MAG: UDP-glucose/GDP-mannose dehydrogenase family protein [Acidobacteria bacterium]|nr:UDP-glucose/GDP-mannose dehydrogenase family protein [Acidobacteriota bacterium]
MRIAVIGCGYVGLVTAACLGELGHDVTGYDDDPVKQALLQSGGLPLYEPHLDELVKRHRGSRLRFSGDAAGVYGGSEIFFVCVNTPPLPTGDADLSPLGRVARNLAAHVRGRALVVGKSTVPVRTAATLAERLAAERSGAEFEVASNPEFLREGSAIYDFLHPDRIVLGVSSLRAEQQLRELYQPLFERRFHCPTHQPCTAPPPPVLVTDTTTAELIKHASNSFLALKISYANALADICDLCGGDVEKVVAGMGLDPRIGPHFLRAGLGFGGFCLPKDVQAFGRMAERLGYDFGLLAEVERINQERIARFLDKARELAGDFSGKTVALLGLSFKPDTDDIRFAPSLSVIEALLREHALVRAYDPRATAKVQELFATVTYASDAYEAASSADCLLLLTEWEEFQRLDWERMGNAMNQRRVVDGRNCLDPAALKRAGFTYRGMGRPA